MFRISNVGLSTSLNFKIQGHAMKLVEVEGSNTIQNIYDSLDVHVGQSVSVLVTLNQPPKDYYIVASTRFTRRVLTATAVLHYSNSKTLVSGPVPVDPSYRTHWSMKQARTYRYIYYVTQFLIFDFFSLHHNKCGIGFVSISIILDWFRIISFLFIIIYFHYCSVLLALCKGS